MTMPAMTWEQMRRFMRPKTPVDPYSLGGYTTGVDATGAAAGGRGEQAQDAYISRASSFDASKSLNDWARGAYANVSAGLDRRLRDLSGAAVGSGRLNTGFFDEDQGQLIRDTQADFTNNLSQQALGAAELQQRNDTSLGAYGERQTEFATDIAQSRREEMINAAREQAERARRRKRGIGSAIGGALGAAGGFLLGGPAGAATGWNVGRSVAGSF